MELNFPNTDCVIIWKKQNWDTVLWSAIYSWLANWLKKIIRSLIWRSFKLQKHVSDCWVTVCFNCLQAFCPVSIAPIQGKYTVHPLWTEQTLFSGIFIANHQLLIDSVSLGCASKWCCPSVLSLCTVNTVTDSWLHLKLWGHYILTGSVFTLYLFFNLLHSLLLSLHFLLWPSLCSHGIILSLDASIKKFTLFLLFFECAGFL